MESQNWKGSKIVWESKSEREVKCWRQSGEENYDFFSMRISKLTVKAKILRKLSKSQSNFFHSAKIVFLPKTST